jgi:hypothetical protein
MQRRQPAVFFIALLTSSLWASFLTSIVWTAHIEGKAFSCNDETFPFAWFNTNLDTHQQSGDTLGVGWTWEKIRSIQQSYERAYYALWALGTALAFYMYYYRRRKPLRDSRSI